MKTKIFNGNYVANKIIENISKKLFIALNSGKYNGIPSVSIIVIGYNFSSEVYIKNKINKSKILGYKIFLHRLIYNISEYKLIKLINNLNKNDLIHAIILQLPLPDHINTYKVVSKITPNKDVDSLNPYNLGKLYYKKSIFESCTSYGIITLLKMYKIKVKELYAVIIGTSNIVGKPMSIELINRGCIVTIINKNNYNIKNFIKNADLLIVAVGIPKFISGKLVKKNSILIDVGINRTNNNKITGDIDIIGALNKSSYITPVPGGVGPVTIAILLKNIFKAFKINSKKNIIF